MRWEIFGEENIKLKAKLNPHRIFCKPKLPPPPGSAESSMKIFPCSLMNKLKHFPDYGNVFPFMLNVILTISMIGVQNLPDCKMQMSAAVVNNKCLFFSFSESFWLAWWAYTTHSWWVMRNLRLYLSSDFLISLVKKISVNFVHVYEDILFFDVLLYSADRYTAPNSVNPRGYQKLKLPSFQRTS